MVESVACRLILGTATRWVQPVSQILQPSFGTLSQSLLQAPALLVTSRASGSGRVQLRQLCSHLGLEVGIHRSEPRCGRDRRSEPRVVEH